MTTHRHGMIACLILACATVWLFDPLFGGNGMVAPAAAREAPRLASFALPTDQFSEKAAATLNYLGRKNLEQVPEFKLLDVGAFLTKDADDPRLIALEKANLLLDSGKKQYDNLELDGAIDNLSKSVEMFHNAAGRLGSGQEYQEALLFLGAAYLLSGDSERGTDAFRMVVLFDREKVLDQKIFPPSLIEMFNGVKEEIAAAPVGTVLVKSTPAAAEVYLDGVFKGISPLTLADVPEGNHFIQLEKDGYLPWGKQVGFYATHEETSEAVLEEAPSHSMFVEECKGLLSDLQEDPPKKKVVELGEWLGVDRLLLVSTKQRGDEVEAEAVMIQVQPPKKLAFRSASFNLTSANFFKRADAFFSSMYREVDLPPDELLVKSTVRADDKTSVGKCHSDSDCTTGEVCDAASARCIPYAPEGEKFYEKWWFWTLIGGGLAAAGGTAVLVWYLTQPDQGSIVFKF